MGEEGFKFLGVRWAPLSVSWERRMQVFVAALWIFNGIFSVLVVPVIFYYLIFHTSFFLLPFIYINYMLWDRETPHRGGRRSQGFREFWLWEYFADYFPIKMHKTAPLDPTKNYIFGCHPHGVYCASHATCFGTEATGFKFEFPGITPHMCTLTHFYFLPFYRDISMLAGACSASKESLNYILSKPGGQAACLVIGGAAEAMDTDSKTIKLVLKNRKGFVKMALRNGAHLVPVFSFGENDIFKECNTSPGSFMRRIQDLVRKLTGIPPLLFYGRGVFQYSLGLVPFRRPINVVIGASIEVPKIEEPTQEDIDEYHSKYMDKLNELYDTHKHKYAPDTNLLYI